MKFDLPKEKFSIIKVIGVGGGGSNAVIHMFKQGIKDVDFLICNTDRQVLDSAPIPNKIQLGAALTEGLGAGSVAAVGKECALENLEDIKNVLSKNTKMVFITAGLGGGTGTGAAPVIAQTAQELGILTVSIVTLPFAWEGKLRMKQAQEGLEELKKYSDAVLVVLNDKLREIYHNLKVSEAFAHADNVLGSAAKSIAEIINVTLRINVDFNDVRRVMEKSGVAIMGSATAAGEGRSLKAVSQALNSPLLNDNDIRGARFVLVSITCGSGKDELTMDELAEITDYIQEAAGQSAELIKGYGVDESLGDKVGVTIIASGFTKKSDMGFETPAASEVKMFSLEEEIKIEKPEARSQKPETKEEKAVDVTEPFLKSELPPVVEEKKPEIVRELLVPPVEIKPVEQMPPVIINKEETKVEEEEVVEDETFPEPFIVEQPKEQISFEFDIPSSTATSNLQQEKKEEVMNLSTPVSTHKTETVSATTTQEIKSSVVPPVQENNSIPAQDDAERKAKAQEKIQKLRELSFKLRTPGGLAELESEPAYKRRNVTLNDTPHSSDSEISRFTLGEGEDKKPTLRPDNSFLHDKPD